MRACNLVFQVKSSPGFGSDMHETDQYVYEEEGTTVSEQEFENISGTRFNELKE